MQKLKEVDQVVTGLRRPEMAARLRIQSVALKAVHDYMARHGVTQLMPILLSPVTDPLCHEVGDASIRHDGQELQLTKSMLLHKQAAFIIEGLQRLYIVSPNVRLEPSESSSSGRHLLEFSQVDIEFRDATAEEFRAFAEELVVEVIKAAKESCAEELESLGRRLVVPERPFAVYDSRELSRRHGKEYEAVISRAASAPFWTLDHEREFYDREERPGHYRNYDLVWPEGYGEALSGGERDYDYETLRRKLLQRGQSEQQFAPYMALAKQGLLVPTAGGGLGVERLVRYLTGASHIAEATLFPRVPGRKVAL